MNPTRFLAALCLLPGLLAAADVSLNEQGLAVKAGGTIGTLTLGYPALTGDGGGERRQPEKVVVDGNRATLTYQGGASLELDLAPQGSLRVHATNLAAQDKGISFRLDLPVELAGEALWSIEGSQFKPLPVSAGDDAFIWRGDAKRFTLKDTAGKGLSISIEHGYQQLQDNRVWNTQAFGWISDSALPRSGGNEAWFNLHLLDPGAALPAARPAEPATPAPAAPPARAAADERLAMRLSDKGIDLACGSLGTFTLGWPQLDFGDDKKHPPAETRIDGAAATLNYEGGATITVTASAGKITLGLDKLPAAVKAWNTEFLIPPNFNEGGRWKTDDADGIFPQQKPAKPHLYQDHSRSFGFSDVNNKHLAFALPEYTYVQLQDNREWGWNTFWTNFKVPCTHDRKSMEISVALDASAARRVVLVDKFGQTTRREFPGKITDEAQLKSDAGAEADYYAGFKPPVRNRFGGLPDSGAKLGLKKSGFFHVEPKTIGKREVWVLVDPAGDAFFHLGLCSFGPGDDYTSIENRSDTFEWLPPHDGPFAAAWHPDKWWNPRAVSFYKANVIRKFGSYDDNTHLARLIDRVRQVGFNSVGAFSGGPAELFAGKNFPRVASLPLGTWTLGPAIPGLRGVFDPFDETILAKMDGLFAGSVAADAGDPLIIGYFLDNEQGFEDLPRAIPALPAKHACKRALIDMLRKRYPGIRDFNTAWNLDAASFDDLAERGLPLATKAAYADMQAFNELFLETYYRAVTDCFRKHDPNHMLIGNRWQPGTANSETLCRIAGKYMDVISINYYACGIDEPFIRRLHQWSGRKPQMWSEFYFTAGNESNASPASNDLATQRERGLAYRHYVEGAAALGFVVGIEWFTLIDQAVSGRFFEGLNGERNNTGLFNVADRPYSDMLAGMAATHAAVYDVWLDGKAPYRFDHPRFSTAAGATRSVSAGHPVAAMAIDGQLAGWPGRPPERIASDRMVAGRENAGTEASFKVCWDDTNLYLLATITDATPMKNDLQGDHLWSGDGIELFIGGENPDQGGPLLFSDRQILLGAGKDNQFHAVNQPRQPAITTAVIPSPDATGYTIEAAIPWSALDLKPMDGLTILFDLAVNNSTDGRERACQLVWNGKARNSSDRSAWGRLTLAP